MTQSEDELEREFTSNPQIFKNITFFFVMFSKLEGALKNTEYIKKTKKYVEADWSDFYKNNESEIIKALNSVTESCKYLLNNPPKILTTDPPMSNKIAWKKKEFLNDIGDAFRVIELIKIIRNNLFHGSKTLSTYGDATRDIFLITHATKILYILSEVKTIKPFFDQGFFN
jgi:hypothetical protein